MAEEKISKQLEDLTIENKNYEENQMQQNHIEKENEANVVSNKNSEQEANKEDETENKQPEDNEEDDKDGKKEDSEEKEAEENTNPSPFAFRSLIDVPEYYAGYGGSLPTAF